VTPISLGIFASANQSVGVTSYESIATVSVGAGGSSSVTFNSIPSDYTHLQIRFIGKSTLTGTSGADFALRFNSDSAVNYNGHQLYGDGSGAFSGVTDGTAELYLGWVTRSGVTPFAAYVSDILDYKNTNKFKTVRSLGGWDNNGTGFVIYRSGVWRSTAAITSITVIQPSGSLAQYSHLALYGIKGA
jgi:hypothetical protein